jgi:hypothetical protein
VGRLSGNQFASAIMNNCVVATLQVQDHSFDAHLLERRRLVGHERL